MQSYECLMICKVEKIQVPSVNQTWLAGKAPFNGGFKRKTMILMVHGFQCKPCLVMITGG